MQRKFCIRQLISRNHVRLKMCGAVKGQERVGWRRKDCDKTKQSIYTSLVPSAAKDRVFFNSPWTNSTTLTHLFSLIPSSWSPLPFLSFSLLLCFSFPYSCERKEGNCLVQDCDHALCTSTYPTTQHSSKKLQSWRVVTSWLSFWIPIKNVLAVGGNPLKRIIFAAL